MFGSKNVNKFEKQESAPQPQIEKHFDKPAFESRPRKERENFRKRSDDAPAEEEIGFIRSGVKRKDLNEEVKADAPAPEAPSTTSSSGPKLFTNSKASKNTMAAISKSEKEHIEKRD